MKKVAVIMGSASDLPVVRKAAETLRSFGVPFEVHVYSAHRTPDQAAAFARSARENGFAAIIAAAGMAAVPQAVRPIPPVNPAPPVPAPVPRQEGGGEGNLPGAEANPCCMGTEAEGARLENMEGAALFAACAALGVRCCEIRAVANYVGDPFEQWDIPCAVANLTETLRDLFADAE